MEPLKMVERIQNRFFVCLKILARMLLAAMIVSASIHAAHAEIFFGERGLDEDEEEAPKVKKEMPLVLPAFPKEENLLPFEVSPTQTQEFFIDSNSLTVGEDEIRYTMVSKSRAGAVNILTVQKTASGRYPNMPFGVTFNFIHPTGHTAHWPRIIFVKKKPLPARRKI